MNSNISNVNLGRLSVGRVSESTSSEPDGLVLETSSCEEGTLMGSSGEETTLRLEGAGVSSMLADAMTETSIREQSPISSERYITFTICHTIHIVT